jgi:hypothetical protein
MHAQPEFIVNWLGILVLAALVTAIIASVKHPAVRPWLLAAIVFVSVVVCLRWLAMPAGSVVQHFEDGNQMVTYTGESRIKGFAFAAVLLPLAIGGQIFAARRGHGHRGLWFFMGAALGLFLLGFIWTSARHVVVHGPPTPVGPRSAWPATPPRASDPVPGDTPIDEQWMNLNEPRIQLASKPVEPVAPDAGSPPAPEPPAATTPVMAESESSWDDDSTHEDATEATEAAATTAADAVQAQQDHASDAAREARESFEASAEPPPEWVGEQPRMVGDVYRVPVEAGPYTTVQECHPVLRENLRRAVNDRLVELVREATGQPHVYVPSVDYLNIGSSFIDRELVTEQYVQTTISKTVGPMKTAWALLEFTPQQDQQLVDAWKRHARREGIAKTSLAAVLVLVLLGGAFALLQIDTWTRGYYTKRLFLGVPAAIIAVILLIALGEL